MTKSIYNDRDYFDNMFKETDKMFKEIKDDLASLKEEISGSLDRPGLRDRVNTIERNIKVFVMSIPAVSALYVKESREFMINLIKNWIV